MHPAVSKMHAAVHARLPPLRPSPSQLASRKSRPSQPSAASATPSPHTGALAAHPAMSNLQFTQPSSPVLSPNKAQLAPRRSEPSQPSAASATPFPHSGIGSVAGG